MTAGLAPADRRRFAARPPVPDGRGWPGSAGGGLNGVERWCWIAPARTIEPPQAAKGLLSYAGSALEAAVRRINIHETMTGLSRPFERAARGEPPLGAKAREPMVKVAPLNPAEFNMSRRGQYRPQTRVFARGRS
ncbi:hypothetical protein GCM10009416_27900 [Craurococcus roseus]|uniref:Transposase n=1 Tax=Craurococcus roseus TaxID=77585 RepID=A0ABP3QBS1_9PROT